MDKAVNRLREAVDRKKEQLRISQQLLREKEKQRRAKRSQEIGRLAIRAKIDQLDHELLLGAFLQIKRDTQQESCTSRWRELAQNLQKTMENREQIPIAIAFPKPPAPEIIRDLKSLGFRWNRFRGEYHGHARKKIVEKLLEGITHQLEVMS